MLTNAIVAGNEVSSPVRIQQLPIHPTMNQDWIFIFPLMFKSEDVNISLSDANREILDSGGVLTFKATYFSHRSIESGQDVISDPVSVPSCS